jgi:hypothetical protein
MVGGDVDGVRWIDLCYHLCCHRAQTQDLHKKGTEGEGENARDRGGKVSSWGSVYSSTNHVSTGCACVARTFERERVQGGFPAFCSSSCGDSDSHTSGPRLSGTVCQCYTRTASERCRRGVARGAMEETPP